MNNQNNITNTTTETIKEQVREEISNVNSVIEEEAPRMHLPTVKELDSFDSSILSNQMKRAQFIQSPVDKLSLTQNFASLEIKEVQYTQHKLDEGLSQRTAPSEGIE